MLKKQNVFIMGKMTKLKQNPEVGKIIQYFRQKKRLAKDNEWLRRNIFKSSTV